MVIVGGKEEEEEAAIDCISQEGLVTISSSSPAAVMDFHVMNIMSHGQIPVQAGTMISRKSMHYAKNDLI